MHVDLFTLGLMLVTIIILPEKMYIIRCVLFTGSGMWWGCGGGVIGCGGGVVGRKKAGYMLVRVFTLQDSLSCNNTPCDTMHCLSPLSNRPVSQ